MINCEEWYKLRDDRTSRYNLKGFESRSIGVLVDDRVIDNISFQYMVLCTANILARWCRKVTFQLPSCDFKSVNPKLNSDFKELVLETLKRSDPCGEFNINEIKEDEFDEILIIGNKENAFKKSHVNVSGGGWLAGIAYGKLLPCLNYDNNPIGPVFAACLANVELFKGAVGFSNPGVYSKWYSLFDFTASSDNPGSLRNPKFNNDASFGRIYQIGCGAVGSSLDYLFSLTGWESEIYLMDYDTVGFTDCNRSPILNANNVNEKKINVCAETLRSTNMHSIPFEGSYSDYIKTKNYLKNPPDIILCLANERNIWSDIQNNFPPIVLHSTTTLNWGLNFGRHIPKTEWCIMCSFSDFIVHEQKAPCSEGKIVTHGEKKEVIAVLPFLSTASAVLMFAELAKMSFPEYPVNSDFIVSSLLNPNDVTFNQLQLGSQEGCMCIGQNERGYYPKEIIGTKFWKLVENKGVAK